MRWHTATRYYRVESYRDLLGHLVVVIAHGGRFNNLGRLRIMPVADEQEREAKLRQLARRRAQRRYWLCRDSPLH